MNMSMSGIVDNTIIAPNGNLFNVSNMCDALGNMDVNYTMSEIFRVIGLYPRVIFYLAVGSFVLFSIINFFYNTKLVREYQEMLYGVATGLTGFVVVLLIPVTYRIEAQWYYQAYPIAQGLMALIILAVGVKYGVVIYRKWKSGELKIEDDEEAKK